MGLTTSAILAAAADDASGVDLLIPHTSELIAGIVAFAIIFFVVWKFAGPAINETLANRQAAIKGQIEAAEKEKAEAAQLLEDYKAQLAGAREDANRIVEESRQAGEQVKADIVDRANAEAGEIVAKARAEADTEKARALQEARSEVASLSLELAAKVVGETLDTESQRRLVDTYLADLDRSS